MQNSIDRQPNVYETKNTSTTTESIETPLHSGAF